MAKPAPMISRSVEGIDKKQHIFVTLSTNELWLCTATCGSGRPQTGMSRTSLITLLRGHVEKLCDGEVALDATPMDELETPDNHDPMDEITSASTTKVAPSRLKGRGVERTRYYGNRARNCIVTVNVPCRPPEIDPDGKQMRAVRLFIVDRKTVWLSLDDVAWAIRYLFDQAQLKGVPRVAADDAGPSDDVATGRGSYIQWADVTIL